MGFAAVLLPAAPAWAAVIGIDKSVTGVPADGVEPGGSFNYVLRAECTSLSEDCQNVTVTDTLPAEFTASLVPGTFTWSGGPDTVPPGGTVFAGIPQYTYSYDAGTRAFTFIVPSLPAGTSASIQIGMTLPADTDLPDGTLVPNTAGISADNAPPASDSIDVKVHVPTVLAVKATKDWADGSALAQSGEISHVTLTTTNASTGAADATQMAITDQTSTTPATDPWNYFTLTGFGAVTYPTAADQVQILYCTLPYAQACGAWTAGAVQSGATLQPDAGVDLTMVTGVQFVFSSSTGAEIDNGASGSVAFDLQLRDTTRLDGSIIEPTQTQTLTNSATPTVTNAGGTATGNPASDTFQIVPNIATVDVEKSWFPDKNGDYQPDNPPVAPGQRRWPVASTIDATNTSPFPVETMTIREPSASDPQSGLSIVDLTQVRVRFPDGAATAHVTITCADGSTTVKDLANPPTMAVLNRPADFTCPAAGPDNPRMKVTSIEITFASPPGTAAIQPNAVAGLDFAGTLDDNAVPGNSPYTNCADGNAVNTGNGSTSATATTCAILTVVTDLGPSGPGTKTVSQSELPEDTPIDYTISFTNDGGPLNDFVLVDPAAASGGLTNDTQPFSDVQILAINASCPTSPGNVTLLIPNPGGGAPTQVPYASATPAQLEAARGFTIAADPLPSGATCRATVTVQRRPGVPDGVTIQNCYLILANGGPAINGDLDASTSCAPNIITSPPRSAASLQKFIEPGSVARPIPGLTPQLATVKLRIANTGNTHLKTLTIIDSDDDGAGSDFFRSFDVVAVQGVSYPPGADLAQLDVCTTGCASGTWINGTASSANPPAIPAGVSAAEIQGLRITFSSSNPANSGYNLTPGENFPNSGLCPQASFCYTVTPRATDRQTGEPVLGTYTDTASGKGESLASLGGDFDIPAVTADLAVTNGRPAIDVDKTVAGPASIAPGQTALFDLTTISTGTAALPDLEISDPVPAGLEFDETGVGGQPYAIQQFDVPAGTTPPGPVAFTTERDGNGTVTRLVWHFPGPFYPTSKLVIRIGMKMAAGSAAGTTATNVMGAGSAGTDDFDCSGSPPDGITDGDPFLPGRNCTSQAQVTTTAGAAFSASKWSAGNPALGLYDSVRAVFTAVNDPQCPQRIRQGVRFTRYPCAPLVYPGQNFTFLANLLNSGTFSAQSVRLVDVLPAPGDTGVIDPADRGTMWDVRPRLVSAPVISAPSDGTVVDVGLTYTADGSVCAANLDPTGVCPPSAWTTPFDAAATGFQIFAQFASPGLSPGAFMDIVWQMTSPADLAQPQTPSLAWNSFGHTEVINTPGVPQRLGKAEPQKAGMGLVFGAVTVTKVERPEPGATVPAGSYQLTYQCVVTPDTGDAVTVRQGTADFGPGKPWLLDNVPANATCTILETGTQGGSSDHGQDRPLTVLIPWSATAQPATAEITNSFPAPPPLPATGIRIYPMLAGGSGMVLFGLLLLLISGWRPRARR